VGGGGGGSVGGSPESVGIGGPGSVWTLEASGIFGGRFGHNCVSFDGKLWIIAGYSGSNYLNDIWMSANGVNWTKEAIAAGFSPRYRAACAVFDDGSGEKLWLIGGAAGLVHNNEIWNSSDGANWTLVGQAPFSSREAAVCLNFHSKLWIIGGYGETLENSVWSSSNGVNWTQEAAAAAFSPRYRHAGVVFGGSMWITGGWNGATELNDSWHSTDGVTWTQATSSTPFSARSGHSCLSFNNLLWVIAGQKGATLYNDVWSSSDGASWTLVTGEAGFSKRFDLSGAVFDSGLWVTGGTDGANYRDDVWLAR
jgi:hypothetical protein